MSHRGKANETRDGYDRVAAEYAARIYGELAHKPLDRALLDRFAARVRGLGTVCDLGAGPGHVARYLYERGCDVVGLDLSPRMVAGARELNPGITFTEGDMLALDVPDASWAAITAMYSIVNLPRADLLRALAEMYRTLKSNGVLLLAFHIGEEVVHLDEWWGSTVSIDFTFFMPHEVRMSLESVGFEVEDVVEREPYPDVEHQSRRGYVLARKP